MKQGKTEKAVFAKLASQKVELGKIEDMRSAIDKADDKYRNATKFVMRANEAFDEAANAYDDVLKIVADTEQFLKEAEAKGFPQNSVKSTVEKFKQLATSMMKQSQKYASTALTISKF